MLKSFNRCAGLSYIFASKQRKRIECSNNIDSKHLLLSSESLSQNFPSGESLSATYLASLLRRISSRPAHRICIWQRLKIRVFSFQQQFFCAVISREQSISEFCCWWSKNRGVTNVDESKRDESKRNEKWKKKRHRLKFCVQTVCVFCVSQMLCDWCIFQSGQIKIVEASFESWLVIVSVTACQKQTGFASEPEVLPMNTSFKLATSWGAR